MARLTERPAMRARSWNDHRLYSVLAGSERPELELTRRTAGSVTPTSSTRTPVVAPRTYEQRRREILQLIESMEADANADAACAGPPLTNPPVPGRHADDPPTRVQEPSETPRTRVMTLDTVPPVRLQGRIWSTRHSGRFPMPVAAPATVDVCSPFARKGLLVGDRRQPRTPSRRALTTCPVTPTEADSDIQFMAVVAVPPSDCSTLRPQCDSGVGVDQTDAPAPASSAESAPPRRRIRIAAHPPLPPTTFAVPAASAPYRRMAVLMPTARGPPAA